MAGREPEGFETETEITPEMLEASEQEQPAGETENESGVPGAATAPGGGTASGASASAGACRSFAGASAGLPAPEAADFPEESAAPRPTIPTAEIPTTPTARVKCVGTDAGGYRAPAYRAYRYGTGYRYGSAYRPAYRYGYGRSYVGRRYPIGARYPYAGRDYARAGRYWPSRRYYGATRYAPAAYRRWPWLYRRAVGGYQAPFYAPPAAPVPAAPVPVDVPQAGGGPSGSPVILLVQGCLRRLFGPGATPSDGVLGPETRRALRAFQRQNGLPPSGDIDNPTVRALQGACLGGAAAAAPPPEPAAGPPPDAGAAPPAEPPPGEPSAGGEPPAYAGAAPPEGAASPGGGDAPPADAQGEIAFGRHESEAEQEFRVDGPVEVRLERQEPVALDRDPEFKWMPNRPGLYIIYVNKQPWYVGIAESSLRARFLQRSKALNDLQVPASALANRTVVLYLLGRSTAPRGAILRKEQDNPRAVFRPLFGPYGALRIAEQVYLKMKNPGAKQLKEPVQFSSGGSLIITENGNTVATYQPNSQLAWKT